MKFRSKRYTQKKRALNKGIIGEGFHGKTVQIAYNPYGTGLSNLLEDEQISKITLYTVDPDAPVVLTEDKDIKNFLKFIHDLHGKIAKLFKDRYFLTGSTIKQDLEEEVQANRDVISYYGRTAEKFLTIAPIHKFQNTEFLATIVEIVNKPTLYITYATMCDNKYPMRFGRFAAEILESIVILQKANYQHNDIKLDNVVLCDDRYKLIDWGQAGSIDEIKIGDMISTSPIKWYVKGAPGYFAQKIMNVRTRMVDYNYEQSAVFQDTYSRIRSEFYKVISETPNPHELFEKYKTSFDIFMVGMTLLHAVHRFSLNHDKYKPLIDALTSIENPITDPKVALKLAKKYV